MKRKLLLSGMAALLLSFGLVLLSCDTGDSGGGNNGATYTVSFDGNGGSAPSAQTVNAGSSTTLPSTTRSGYNFNGWYTSSSGGTSVGGSGSAYTPSSSVTLYAHWTQSGTGDGTGDGTGNGTTGLYMGIIGFNQNINTREIGLLNNSTKGAFQSFVNAMTTKAGTVLYYAVENALDKLSQATLPDDLTNASIITFTDGLDQGSVELNETYNGSNTAYLAAIGDRIQTSKIKNLNISAYSIGIKGTDVIDMEQFTKNLNNIASSSANAYEVTSMTQVQSKFQDIANSLYNESSDQIIKLDIPGQEDGKKVRFTFDNVSDPANSTIYIEGTYAFATKSLTNIVYQGCSSSSGTTVAGVQNGIFISFSFAGLKPTSGSSVPVNAIKQWGQTSGATNWQINSEFSYDPDTITTVERKSAVIILVLDCSSSLSASDFSNIKNSANSFINTLIQEDSSGDPSGESAPSAPTGVTANAQSSSSIRVSWNSVSGATSYYVYRSDSSSGTYTQVGSPTGASYTDSSGLSPNTTYYYKVSAGNSAGESSQSTYTSATTSSSSNNDETKGEDYAPSAPTGLMTDADSSDIYLYWDFVYEASSYYVYRSDSAYGTYTQVGEAIEPSYYDYEASSNTTYYYKVTAVNSAGESAYSSYISATKSSSSNEVYAPSAPTDVTATGYSSEVHLFWGFVDGASSYYVYRSDSAYGTYTFIGYTINASYQDYEASSNTTYYYKVTAVNGAGESTYSSYVSATTSSSSNDDETKGEDYAPSAPTGLTAYVYSNEIHLLWDFVDEASYYYVYRSDSAYGTYTRVGETTGTYDIYYNDYDVSPDTTYYYKVTAVNSAGESDYSSYISTSDY
jgi:uncharacterized repeat protein (TIGR02543 family)